MVWDPCRIADSGTFQHQAYAGRVWVAKGTQKKQLFRDHELRELPGSCRARGWVDQPLRLPPVYIFGYTILWHVPENVFFLFYWNYNTESLCILL